MIGSATWGPKNVVTAITSLSEFVTVFGDDKTGVGVTGVKGAELFFNNGGQLFFIRAVDATEAESTYMALNGVTSVIKFEGKYEGTYGDRVTVEIIANGSNRNVQVTDGKILEVFSNNGAGYATNNAIAAAINAGSSLVIATVQSGQGVINLADAITATQLSGGDDGETLTPTIIGTAFDDLLQTVDFNFLLVPGFTDNSFHSTMVGKVNTRATTEKKYARFITGIAKDESIATALARTASGKRLTVVAPGVKHTHRIDKTQDVLDGSYLACAYTGMLCTLDVEDSGTREIVNVEGLSVSTSSGKEFYNKVESEQLLQGRIAPIVNIAGAIVMDRGITRNVSTTEIWIEESIVDVIHRRVQSDCDTRGSKPGYHERDNQHQADGEYELRERHLEHQLRRR
jgi:hypothetical protein